MSTSSGDEAVPTVPGTVQAAQPPPLTSTTSSSASSSSDSDNDSSSRRRSRIERPKLPGRIPSGPIVVPKSQVDIKNGRENARSMSPRRTSEDLQKIGEEARQTLYDHAKTLQSSLSALADKIDEVKSDYDRLESENKFLQDYIGGLTKTMSKRDLGSSGKGKK